MLATHNPIEEGEAGLYAICDAVAGSDAAAWVDELRALPKVLVAAHYDGPLLKRS